MQFRVLPYRQGSKSAKALAHALGGKVLRIEGSSWIPPANSFVINWGRTDHAEYPRISNFGPIVHEASNKRTFFQRMSSTTHPVWLPRFWTDAAAIPDDVFPVVCRTVLAGHSGDGIVIANDRAGLVPAPLYVQYLKKKDEYRVHVGNTPAGQSIIAVQRKARRSGLDNSAINWQVRNLANGFVYARNEIVVPPSVTASACDALGRSGLDFGAVDVIFNREKGNAYVLEINTAPGLEGQTIEDYASFFRNVAAGINSGP